MVAARILHRLIREARRLVRGSDWPPRPGCRHARGPRSRARRGSSARLEAAGPFATDDELFAAARRIAHAMPEDEQVELLDAHPRLGAPPDAVSALSYVEQGYDRAGAAPPSRTRRRRRRARAAQRRVRGAVRVPLLRLRGRPARGSRCCPGWPPRSTPTATAELHRAPRRRRRHRRRPACEADTRDDRAQRRPLRQGRHPDRPGGSRRRRRTACAT